ncbi:bifunctional riboflavin kinase/FAD synthetase [Schinkia azotoformans]|uniref:Riboflavin biosynthesis protein n=1 Tax=Schinkia azotoformans LMG 9581 TaxID=1131731 RepID=K6D774_SCHAZ|nr:bifunctional riboflavin kinase/FAD synthetase [Schinkia azotoformans]EKN63928.1 bifunctional riboflavin kinase/FMN adenylyltransferase [Schinkia azotoformans LMG 9581]MEC1638208.1 bifunctional riboflavin kinase/FAD synthetase [Schinkia azotoformans]MEC1946358.1 bifunctional riboflavin kinase/FAD synthetase [Schinkia azotoformans]MED4351794.1 bifunctional riboflavin kinase/FAD synthetase [Schinkia azotoformans]
MKIIELKHPHSINQQDLPPIVLALGYFDGVHLGHQKVIKTAKAKAEELGINSAVMTFYPHPSVVLRKSNAHAACITSIKDKAEEIEKIGIDYLFIVDFTPSFAELLPQQFVDQYIIGLHGKHVVAGFDYTYGRLGKGTMETLPFHSREMFTQTVVEKVVENNEKISSTLIRELILNGDIDTLPTYLGRFYKTKGIVVHGEKRGRTIGFPTANIEHIDEYILPSTGVYAVYIRVSGSWYKGVLNIGYKPTFHDPSTVKLSVEVHIIDFSDSIYDQEVQVMWIKRIRSEQKFNSIDELIAQIQRDKEAAIRHLETIKRDKNLHFV